MLYKFTHNGTKEEIDKFIKEVDILCSLGAIINLEIKGTLRNTIIIGINKYGFNNIKYQLIIYEDHIFIDGLKILVKCV